MTLPLTENQEKLWRYIQGCDRSPTFEEMAVAMGMSCRGGQVSQIVDALEAKGYVRRIPYRSRSIVALDPETTSSLRHVKTSELMAELERRGMLMGCAA